MKFQVILNLTIFILISNIKIDLYSNQNNIDFKHNVLISLDNGSSDNSTDSTDEYEKSCSGRITSSPSSKASSEGTNNSDESSDNSSENSKDSSDNSSTSDSSDSTNNSSESSSDSSKKSTAAKPDSKIVNFVANNMKELKKDIACGNGEYLYTLAELLKYQNNKNFNSLLQNNYSNIYVTADLKAVKVVANINFILDNTHNKN